MTADTEWHEWRRQGIGGSDVAGILGLSRWSSPWSVWADKSGMTPPGEPTEYMEFGKRAEVMVGPWFHDVTGLWVVGEQTWCTHPEHEWARCTVDGFVAELEEPAPDELVGVLEIKTTGFDAWDEIPAHYQAQAQWQLYVTGLGRVHFAVLHGRRFRTYVLERDDTDVAFMAERVGAFWHDHVLAGVPPVADGSTATATAIRTVYADADDQTVEVPAELVAEVLRAKSERQLAETAEKAATNALTAAMGVCTVATVGGQPAATWRPQERRGLDTKALEAEYPEVADKFRTITTSRVLRVK